MGVSGRARARECAKETTTVRPGSVAEWESIYVDQYLAQTLKTPSRNVFFPAASSAHVSDIDHDETFGC